MPRAPGPKIGPYEIQSPLGAGGMGEVYRARDTRLAREVALKLLPESFASDAERLWRFEQEARAVAALNHPNILAIHDIGKENGTSYLVTEPLEGSSLRTLMDGGPLPARKATDYGVQIANGLAAAHEKHLVHRDLKPENLFVTKDGRVKILDFGLAKVATKVDGSGSQAGGVTLTSGPTEPGMVIGTAGYMAPEQVRGGEVDSRADIFAYGAVMYEMASGKRAFRRDTAAETMTAILREDPAELSEITPPVSPGLERIVLRCLEKQPEQRFQSAKDLAFALEALSGTTSKSVAHAAITAEAPKPRSTWLVGAGALTLGILAGGAAVWLLRPAPAPAAMFTPISFHQGSVLHARFGADGKTVVYSAKLNGGPVDTYVIREDYPESVPTGLNGAVLLAVSRQGQLAVLTKPTYWAQVQWTGTLATSPMGGSAPRELMENVSEADWSPDGSEMAVVDREPAKTGWRLQYPIGKVLVDGENWLSDMRSSPNGQHVAFFRHPPNVDDRGDVVVVVDRAGKQTTVSSGWESLEGLAWAPSGKEVWFSAADSGYQYCIRAASLSGKMRIVFCGTGQNLIQDIAPSGRVLVATNEARVSIKRVEHGSSDERDLSWLNDGYGPTLTADGGLVMFTDQSGQAGRDYEVYVRKTDGSAAVRIGSGGFGTDITRDGKWAIILLPGDPRGELQIVPVGPGQSKVLRWDGVQPLWACWYPDGKHILLNAIQSSERRYYVTDADGTTPNLVTTDFVSLRSGVAPDGHSLFVRRNGVRGIRSDVADDFKAVSAVTAGEIPIAWTSDAKHVFVQDADPAGITIWKVDVETGKRELWQTIHPKEQVGLRPLTNLTSITPDGRWMVFAYGTDLGQLYRSDNLR